MKNLGRFLGKFLTEIAVSIIKIYQWLLSPYHAIPDGFLAKTGCRFYPSCSEYAKVALRQYGLFKGIVASSKRILRCNPFNAGGYDPVNKIPNS